MDLCVMDEQTLELSILKRRENIQLIISDMVSCIDLKKPNETKLHKKSRLSSKCSEIESLKNKRLSENTSRTYNNLKLTSQPQTMLSLPDVLGASTELIGRNPMLHPGRMKTVVSRSEKLKAVRSNIQNEEPKIYKPETCLQVPKYGDSKQLPSIPDSYKRGELPKYLISKKQELKKEEERLEEERRLDCPPGHMLLPDTKRLETLNMLTDKREDLISQLRMLPVRNDTLRIQKLKVKIESELLQVEEGIRTFSRPKVFVCLEN